MAQRFSIPITPTEADIDDLGHVSNLVYLRWVQEVAAAHSYSVGWDLPRYLSLGVLFMVRRHEIDYIAQVRVGETLVAETWVEDVRMASCIRKTELKRGEQIVARASTTWAMISVTSQRPQKLPDEIRDAFS